MYSAVLVSAAIPNTLRQQETWAQLGLHRKPIGLLNVEKYFDFLYEFFKHMVKEKFLHTEYKNMILIKENPAEMLDSLIGFQLPHIDKWNDLKKV